MTSGRTLWRHRWFAVAVCFLGINLFGVVRHQPAVTEGPVAAGLDRFSAGTQGLVSGDDALVWRFTTEMVDEAQIGERLATGPFGMAPGVEGTWIWTDARTLHFAPYAAWPLCQIFQIDPGTPLTDRTGTPLEPIATQFLRSAALRLESVEQADIDARGLITLGLRFNHPPSRDQLRQHVVLTQNGERPLTYQLVDDTPSTLVHIRARSLALGEAQLTVRKGLLPSRGLLGLEADEHHTVAIHYGMSLLSLQVGSRSEGSGSISARFSQHPEPAQLGKFVSVEPRVDCVMQVSGHRISLVGDFVPGDAYAVSFRAGLPSREGQTLEQDETRTVYMPNRPASASILGRGQYLSAAGSRMLAIRAVNLDELELAAERVYANNLVYFVTRREGDHGYRRSRSDAHRGISRHTGTLSIPGPGSSNQMTTNRVDLTSLMGEYAAGAYQLTLRAGTRVQDRQLVVVSDIGIAVRASPRGLLVWANSLRGLQPIAQAEVRVYSSANQEIGRGHTDPEGLVHLSSESDETPYLVTVEAGNDINYLCLDRSSVQMPGDIDGRAYLGDGYQAYVFTDRGIYRPGETGRVHAVVRDRELVAPKSFPVVLEVVQPDGQVFRRQTTSLATLGTAEFSVVWPDYAPTGRYALRLMVPGDKTPIGTTAVSVETFVPPGIAVDLDPGEGRGHPGEEISFQIRARHLFGAPAADSGVTGRIVVRPVPFAPAGWSDYHFGDNEKTFQKSYIELGKGLLDAEGEKTFRTTLPQDWRPPAAISLLFAGTVHESSGRGVSAYGSRTVDPYPYYLGIRGPKGSPSLPVHSTIRMDIAAVQPDGNPAHPDAPIRWTLQRIHWSNVMRERRGRWLYESTRQLTPIREESIVLQQGQATVRFSFDQSGSYLLTVADPESGTSSSTSLHAFQGRAYTEAWSQETPDQVSLRWDRERYQAGDTARLHIKAPFSGTALVTIESDRMLHREVVTLAGNTHQVDLPVRKEYQPNVYCCVTLLRPVVPEEIRSPHRALGAIPLRVTDPKERLGVVLQAPDTLHPRSRLQVRVAITGSDAPVEVVLAAVDEGICRLTDFQTPDPLSWFREKRGLAVSHADLYSLLLPELEAELEQTASSVGGGMMGVVRGRLSPIRARRFVPTALWSGPVMTGADGTASIALEVPEFTGALRLMAVAVGDRAFGSASAHTTVKRSLVVHSSLPRFLGPGDTCSMPVRIYNETGGAVTARVAIACSGPLEATSPGTGLVVEAGANQGMDVNLKASRTPGVATVHLVVQGGGERYEESFELPIRPLSPRQVQSGAGTVEPGGTVRIPRDQDWVEGSGRYQLWCAGHPTLQLAGGIDYLLRYPYGCVEQTTSAAFPLLYLADLVERVQPGRMSPEDVVRYVDHGILRLYALQRPGGEFRQWSFGTEAYPWGSIYATHFLVEARRAGYAVDEGRIRAALDYLQVMLDRAGPHDTRSSSTRNRDRICRAYACHVLALGERIQESWINRLYEQVRELPASAQIHLAAAMALSGQREDAQQVLEQLGPAAVTPVSPEGNRTLDSPTRDVALRLSAWLLIDPRHPEVAGLAQRLNRNMNNGHWRTTQENAAALLALGSYSRYLRDQSLAFTGRVSWADGDRYRVITQEAPMLLEPTDGGEVVLTNRGPGPYHYYWRSSGVPVEGSVQEEDRRLSVRRRLLDAHGQTLPSLHLRRGDLVQVRLDLDSHGARLDDLIIEDLLPAGLEIENPRLKTSEQAGRTHGTSDLPVRHVDPRDDRMLIFTGAFTGQRSYHYAARAVTPGIYTLPPIAAEAMYEPEVRSLHGKATLEVAP